MEEENKHYGLSAKTIAGIQSVFTKYPTIEQVILYGSRAKGNYREGSDIDLTLITTDDYNQRLLVSLLNDIDNLNTPYSFDISLYKHIDNDNLLDHIKRVGVEFYNAQIYQQQQQERQKQVAYTKQARQSEAALEHGLIEQLQGLGYEKVAIKDEKELIVNLQKQLQIHNNTTFTESEFTQILNKLATGNIFEKAQKLRDKVDYQRDDGTVGYVELIDQIAWCKNQYQVTHQITMVDYYENRYDVTLLINGLPLVQIELKRRGIELKEAFNQLIRYHQHSFSAGYGLFSYIQLLIISNGVNTKYFANTPAKQRDFKQTFFWKDADNNRISNLSEFASEFLEKCQLSKMIVQYIVLNDTDKILMALRSYQYYAVEAIVKRVENSTKFGYIWHTTGSGKTLTSFKTAQILTRLPYIHKVVFVVDRKDLDHQTITEFNSFSEGSVDATNNTKKLVEQFTNDTPLIVTTLQKLNTAISNSRHKKAMQTLQNQRMVFIFDECHRSQFGDTHTRIKEYFHHVQMFGFTGTPIFDKNAAGSGAKKRTTKDLFSDCLHKYLITDAIADENVLRFSIEYYETIKVKEGIRDLKVEDIDKSEVFESKKYLENVADFIIDNHDRKTHNKEYTAIFCVANVPTLIKYYELFQQKQHDLRIGTIFSYQANHAYNEDNPDIDDEISENASVNKHHREKLDEFIGDYNKMFDRNYSSNDFYSYYQDIAKQVKNKKLDVLLVVNMFLTGFDSPLLNTIYVDKNLKYHGLIQAFSRTNRIKGQKKSQGNVVCFRNLKQATDQAIELFANKDAVEVITIAPYETYVEQFANALDAMQEITPTVDSVDDLLTEEDEAKFIQAFRNLIRIKNIMSSFAEFQIENLGIDQQLFEDYQSKYLDLYDKVKSDNSKEKVSILNDIDFEVELIHRDKINVSYILELLQQLHLNNNSDKDKQYESILSMIGSEVQLRSKRELIEKFIAEQMPMTAKDADISDAFDDFWQQHKSLAIHAMSDNEELDYNGLEKMIGDYLFTGKLPLNEHIIAIMQSRPKLKERKFVLERIREQIKSFTATFIEGVD